MLKRVSVLSVVLLGMLGMIASFGCEHGRRSVAVRGPYHRAEVGYDVETEDGKIRDVDLVGDVDDVDD